MNSKMIRNAFLFLSIENFDLSRSHRWLFQPLNYFLSVRCNSKQNSPTNVLTSTRETLIMLNILLRREDWYRIMACHIFYNIVLDLPVTLVQLFAPKVGYKNRDNVTMDVIRRLDVPASCSSFSRLQIDVNASVCGLLVPLSRESW